MEKTNPYQAPLPLVEPEEEQKTKRQPKSARRANSLDGVAWTRNSISIWSDIKKTQEETRLGHPAIFPIALATRLIQCFTTDEDRVILDPFVGIGSTAIAAQALGKVGIGIEISEEFAHKARKRPLSQVLDPNVEPGDRIIHCGDARRLLDYVSPESVDMVITSPPYWDILLQERTADYKEVRHYGNTEEDLGKIRNYDAFLQELKGIFSLVYRALKPGKYCCIIVMDLRKKDKFYSFHSDVSSFMQEIGFIYDDLVIWDRRHEYNNMRPLGYPYKFRINKAHEFLLIFQKRLEG